MYADVSYSQMMRSSDIAERKETMQLDQVTLRAYQQRWQAVAEIEVTEQIQATLVQRWQKMNSLLRLSMGLSLVFAPSSQEFETINQRWNRIRSMHSINERNEHRDPS
jgi:hypothetical protein